MSKYLIALDLEMAQPSQNIIEIGLAVGCPIKREVIDTLSVFINPNEVLTDFIKTLTNITQDNVDKAKTLQRGFLEDVLPFINKYPIQYPLITWGSGDLRHLRTQLQQSDLNFILGRTEMNVKNLAQACFMATGIKLQGGLSKALTRFGLQFSGIKHRAVDDAKNTLILYFTILNKLQCLKLK